jgi:hypothetical protein
LQPQALWTAYLAAWAWGRDLVLALVDRHQLLAPHALLAQLDRRLRDHEFAALDQTSAPWRV